VENLIVCSIRHIEYTKGGYQALSYVWGSAERPHRAVVVDNRNKPVGYIPLTEYLFNALRDIRDSTELTSKVFWIDQICINQNGDEKSHQVAMMAKIYAHAARVVLYVGPSWVSSKDDDTGIRLLQTLAKFFSTNYTGILRSSGNLYTFFTQLKLEHLDWSPFRWIFRLRTIFLRSNCERFTKEMDGNGLWL
jgi:hypothetical protein